jgi:NAD(P)-dependent dehydrogenase (short-subunit alcohol dehydrogenase family)
MSGKWRTDDIPDLDGRTFVVTGATSGLGLATAVELARHGARVVVTGREAGRLDRAWTRVAAAATGKEPGRVRLDLADLASVRRAAADIAQDCGTVHVLINNAGVMAPPLQRTADGFEMQIGTNHLGHFALTGLLLPAMPLDDPTADARVVNVASTAHRGGRIDLDDLNYEHRRYSPWPAYGQSKLANLLFTSELARRAAQQGWALTALAAHPGWAATNLQYAGPAYAHTIVGRTITRAANAALAQSAEAGALPQLRAATDPSVQPDEYYGPAGLMEARGHPVTVGRAAAARSAETAAGLWRVSEELTEVRPSF